VKKLDSKFLIVMEIMMKYSKHCWSHFIGTHSMLALTGGFLLVPSNLSGQPVNLSITASCCKYVSHMHMAMTTRSSIFGLLPALCFKNMITTCNHHQQMWLKFKNQLAFDKVMNNKLTIWWFLLYEILCTFTKHASCCYTIVCECTPVIILSLTHV